MLVLSRKRKETIMIGDNIEVTIVDIRGDTVRLGITAPDTVLVHRKEVWAAIKAATPAGVPPLTLKCGFCGGKLFSGVCYKCLNPKQGS